MVRVFAPLVLICLFSVGAAQADAPNLEPPVKRVIDSVILPGYEALQAASVDQDKAIAALCAAPSDENVSKARAAFSALVAAFSRIEAFRFGPAREENRIERLFFWPDPRGRGLRQVQALLAKEDPTGLSVETLRRKSVAVQGLLSLDFVLSGKGADQLAGPSQGFRCGYAKAIAGTIRLNAERVLQDWRAQDGYASLLLNPGQDNALYRDQTESFLELLKAAREQLQIVVELKIGKVLAAGPQAAKPKRAAFWRSGNALLAIRENIAGVRALLAAMDFDAILPEEGTGYATLFQRELSLAETELRAVEDSGLTLFDALKDADLHGRMRYAAIPLTGVIDLLTEDVPDQLGLSLGFNSRDGD